MPRRKRSPEHQHMHDRYLAMRHARQDRKVQRAACAKAIVVASNILDDFPEMPFAELLARIRRRWPVSCSGERFATGLRRLHDLSPAERERQWWRIAEQAAKAPQVNRDASHATKGQIDHPNGQTRHTRS